MNQNDLRVIKTKESIEKAFLELMSVKPLDKITVLELSRAARIHKSTFYLHYLDMPDLYMKIMQKTLSSPVADADFFPLLFDDPDRFMEEMSRLVMDNLGRLKLLLQDQNRYIPLDPLLAMCRSKIYEMGRIERSPVNDIKLDIVFGAIFICVPNYEGHREEVNEVTAATIRSLFPGGTI